MKPIKLIIEAKNAQSMAKAPYSNYPVGAALLTKDDKIVKGCNIESKAYPTTLCAERVAIFSAISIGLTKFKSIAIVSSVKAKPCGQCRQIIHEYCGDIPIYISDGTKNDTYEKHFIKDLLPHPFG